MLSLRPALASLLLIVASEAAAQGLVPPPMVPSREIDLTADLDPAVPTLAWPRLLSRPDGGCVLGISGERLLAVPIGADGVPATLVVVPLPAGSARSHGFTATVASTGRLHAAYGVDDPAGGRRLAVSFSDDLGRTWSPPAALGAAGTAATGSEFQSTFKKVAVASAGDRVAVAWVSRFDSRVVAAASPDGGSTWTAPVAVTTDVSNFDNYGVDVAISPSTGTIVVASADYVPGLSGFGSVVRTSRSTDGGLTFSAPRLLDGTAPVAADPEAYQPELEVLPDGSLALAVSELPEWWDDACLTIARSTDDGSSWTRQPSIPYSGADTFNYWQVDPEIVVAGGEALLVWPASVAWTAARLDPGSMTFVEPTAIGPAVPQPSHIQGFADVARTASGTWMSVAVRAGSTSQGAMYRLSSDGGRTWSADVPYTTDPALNRFPRLWIAPVGAAGMLGAAFASEPGGDYRTTRVRSSLADPPEAGFASWALVPDALAPKGSSVNNGPFVVATGSDRVTVLFQASTLAGNNTLWARHSVDRGISFGPPVRLDSVVSGQFIASGSLRFAATSDDAIWVFWVVTRPGGGWDLRSSVSRDGGASWLSPDSPAHTATSIWGSSSSLALAAQSGERAWVAWTAGNSLYITSTFDSGATFSTSDGDQSTVNGSSSPYLCESGGRLWLAWRGRLPGLPTQSLVSFSDDGATFSPARAVAWPGGGSNQLLCFPDRSARFVWWSGGSAVPFPYLLSTQAFDGVTLGPAVNTGIPASASTSTPPPFNVRPTPDGALVVASLGDRFGATTIDRGVYAARSEDRGATWSEPVRLDAASPDPAAGDYGIGVASDAEGRVWAGWTEIPAGLGSIVLLSRSDDGGVSWTSPVRLDRDSSPWSRNPINSGAGTIAAVRGAGLVTFQRSLAGNTGRDGILNADDVLDRDRDGSPAGEDCDDANPDLYPGHCGNEPPLADAGPDQVLECTGDLTASATLDGSASSDPDGEEDLASWVWSENGSTIAEGETASASFALGAHDVVLTVTDRAGESGTDDLKVTVRDTAAPTGTITAPAAGLCSATPVTVEATVSDVCDPSLGIAYEPAPGPTYARHGDTTVTVTATDAGGNAGSASVAFTIDTVAPQVAWLLEPGGSIALPATVPMALVFTAADDDGASGGVVHERILLDGCPIFDGATYGDLDGLLSDESLALDLGTLCRFAVECGRSALQAPTLVVEATDCGGNVGAAGLTLSGSVALKPGVCTRSGATSLQPAGGSGLAKESAPARSRIRTARDGRR